jgi:hypothetical protein
LVCLGSQATPRLKNLKRNLKSLHRIVPRARDVSRMFAFEADVASSAIRRK